MTLMISLLAVLVLLFGFVVFFGAPYVPTHKKQTETALDLLALKPGQTLLELGCGDGRVLRAAARRGIRSVGYELSPLLFVIAWLATLRYRKLIKVRWANYWSAKWPPAEGIYVFLLDKYMPKLDRAIKQKHRPLKVVSFAFKIPGKRAAVSKHGLFLYLYE